MKKQKVSEFIRGKSFYLVLLTGLCAVIVIALVYTNLVPGKKDNGLVDLNEPIPNVVSQDKTSTDVANNNESAFALKNNTTDTAKADYAEIKEQNGSLLENDIVEEETETSSTETMSNSASGIKEASDTAEVTKKVVNTKTVPVVETNTSSAASLNFHEEDGLSWPIDGNVLLNFNMEHSVYFETLGEYKVNPAIIIQGEVGTEVISATKGIVTDIVDNEETGKTITMSIGSGYNLVYGQLKDAKVEVGETIEEGEMLGIIAEPTKYYIVEGSNLYFQVLKDDEAINPMLLLKD